MSTSLRTRLPSLVLFFMTASFIIVKTARDALYFQEDGLYALPKAYLLIAALSVPQAMLILRAIRALGPRATRVLAPTVVVAVLLLYTPFAAPGRGLVQTGFFIFVPLVFSIVFSLAWLLTSELLENAPPDELRRGFGRVAIASMLGGTAGGVVARELGSSVEPATLLLVGVFGVALATGLIFVAHRMFPVVIRPGGQDPQRPEPTDPGGGIKTVLAQAQTPSLLGIGVLGALTGIFIDFQFYVEASKGHRNAQEMAMFFANVYLVLNVAALFVQLLITPRLQARFGLGGALAVMPLALFGGSVVFLGAGAAVGRSVLRVTEGGLKSSVHRSSWEQAYLHYPREMRTLAKVVVDGIASRLAEGLAAAAAFIWLQAIVKGSPIEDHSTEWITATIVGSTLLWMFLTRRLAATAPAQETGGYLAAPVPDG